MLAVSRGEAGSDWSEIRVMDIATKQELPDRVQWVKFSGAAWHGDGFYYSGYDKPAAGEELKAKNEFQKVFYHKLGDPQEKDVLIWEDKEHPLRYVGAGTTEGEEWLILAVSEGTSGSEVWVKDLSKKNEPFTMLFKGFEFDASPLEVVDGKFLVHTNAGAPNFRVVSIDPKDPAPEKWQTVIPEKPEVLSGAGTAGGYLFANYLKDANTKIYPAPARRRARPRDRAPGPRLGRRLRRQARREGHVLHLHLVHLPVDDLQVRPGHRRLRDLPQARGQVRSVRLRDEAGLLRQQGRDQRARCSSSTRRGSSSTARTRPISRPTAASTSA